MNVSQAENSFLPMSITTLALWMVTAQACLRGSCRREHDTSDGVGPLYVRSYCNCYGW